MKVQIPPGHYIKKIEVNDDGLDVQFSEKKRVALVFISLNDRYWPYVKQVIEDCKQNFLPHHKVDYFVWSDMPEKGSEEYKKIEATQWWSKEQLLQTVDFLHDSKEIKVIPTEGMEWPIPTLMRYHLFLNEEETLKDYDYIFYLDADMRVVAKISDEILGDGITAAEHPMYSLRPQYVPPYEPNRESTAYIHRLGTIIDDKGKPRFKPHYVAGGFQGGVSKDFIAAMKVMKENIDKDFDKNYMAIWNDESHWNKYLWDYYKGPLIVLSPSYIYPDSLIKEYYEPIWGQSYEPKIITITKPFSLSTQAGSEINEFLGKGSNNKSAAPQVFQCPQCKGKFETPGMRVLKVLQCPGPNKSHQLEMEKI